MSADSAQLEQIKSAMRRQWMAGDFGVIAKPNAQAAAEFAESLALTPGSRVLDVACGTGNVAIPLARAGCVVTGVDIASNLLAQAKQRAEAEGLSCAFDEGDAEKLPYPDAAFDAVVSMFGVMFAPRPDVAAAEFARVLKPGGLLGMANWNPESFSGAMFRVTSRHIAPPPGVPPPVLWGDETTVRQRLADAFDDIECQLTPILFDLPFAAKGCVDYFRRYFGPTQLAFERLDPAGKTALAADLEGLWAQGNTAPDPDQHTLIHNEYLRIVARRKSS